MKKLTLLLFFTILSTSMLLAQNKELTPNEEMLAMPELKVTSYLEENNVSISDYTMEEDVATQKRIEENAKKSKIAKVEREKQTEAVRIRLQKSENAKAQLKAKKAQQERYKNMKLDANGNPVINNQNNN